MHGGGSIPIGEYILLGACFLLNRELLYCDTEREHGDPWGLLEQSYQ